MSDNSLFDLKIKFKNRYKELDKIDNNWYHNEIGIKSFSIDVDKKKLTKDFEKEFYRACLAWCLIKDDSFSSKVISVDCKIGINNGIIILGEETNGSDIIDRIEGLMLIKRNNEVIYLVSKEEIEEKYKIEIKKEIFDLQEKENIFLQKNIIFNDLKEIKSGFFDDFNELVSLEEIFFDFLKLKKIDELISRDSCSSTMLFVDKKESNLSSLLKENILYLSKQSEESFDSLIKNEKIINQELIFDIIELFQAVSIIKSNTDVLNEMNYNFMNIKKDQFYTPYPLAKSIIRLLNPIKKEDILDPFCNLSYFLIMYFQYIKTEDLNKKIYGYSKNILDIKNSKHNISLNCGLEFTLENIDLMLNKKTENGNVISEIEFNKKNYNEDWEHKININKNIKKHKIITTNLSNVINSITNKIKINQEMYELKNHLELDLIFWIEILYKSLKYGGRCAIIVPKIFIDDERFLESREWLISKLRLIALFDLPRESFTTIRSESVVIIAYKPLEEEYNDLMSKDYDIFAKEINMVGYEMVEKKNIIKIKIKNKKNNDVKKEFLINNDNDIDFNDNDNDIDFNDIEEDFKEYISNQEQSIKDAFNS